MDDNASERDAPISTSEAQRPDHAHIPVEIPRPRDISLKIAATDSPIFRANLHTYEDDLEELSKWLDQFSKGLRTLLEDGTSMNESVKLVIVQASKTVSIQEFDTERLNVTLKTFSEAMMDMHACKTKLLKDAGAKLLFPISQLLGDDIKDLKESRKNCEKICDKYEAAISRYASLSKSRESSALREDAFQLYETRKAYFHQYLNYAASMNRFKLSLDSFLTDKILITIYSYLEYYQSTYEIFLSLKPHMDELRSLLKEKQEQYKQALFKQDASKKLLEDDLKYRFMPDAPAPAAGREKSGYLFRKRQTKSISLTHWRRIYAIIQNGFFSWMTLGKNRTQVLSSDEIHVLLCEIKVTSDQVDRRFCFEIYSTKRTILLQAESEEDMSSWIQTFENAKNHALTSSQHSLTNAEFKHDLRKRSTVDEVIKTAGEISELVSKPSISISSITDGSFTGQQLSYNDLTYQKYNEDLHQFLPSLTKDEYVVSVLPCALQKEVSLQGKLHLTQHRFIFYSNIFGQVTLFEIRFTDVITIQRFEYSFYSTVKITTNENQFTFKTFLAEDTRILTAFNLLHEQQIKGKKMTLQDIYNYVMSNNTAILGKNIGSTVAVTDVPKVESEESLRTEEEKSSSPKPPPTNTFLDTPFGNPMNYKTSEDLLSSFAKGDCGCKEHLERVELDITLPLPCKFIFEGLFGDGSHGEGRMSKTLREKRGLTNYTSTGTFVQDSSTGISKMEAKYMLPVNSALVRTKETQCMEVSKILRKEEYLNYVVEVTAKTPDVPFGDAFETVTRQCMTAIESDKCRYIFSYSIVFYRSSMLKGVIKNAAFKGLYDYAKLLEKFLQDVAKQAGLKPSIPEAILPHEEAIEEEGLFISPAPKKIKLLPFVPPIQLDQGNLLTQSIKVIISPPTIIAILLLFSLSLFMNIRHWYTSDYTLEYRDESIPLAFPLTIVDLVLKESREFSKENWMNRLAENEMKWINDNINLDDDTWKRFLQSIVVDYPINANQFNDTQNWYSTDYHNLDRLYNILRHKVDHMRIKLGIILEKIKHLDKSILMSRYVNWLMDRLAQCYHQDGSCSIWERKILRICDESVSK